MVDRRKTLAVGLALAGLLVVACGCSKQIPTRAISDGFGFCKSLGPKPEAACVGPSLRFQVTDPQAVYRMEFENVSAVSQLRCEWVDPSDRLYLASGPIRFTDDEYRERAVVSCALPIAHAPPSVRPGRWRLDVYYDGGERTSSYRGGLLRSVEMRIES